MLLEDAAAKGFQTVSITCHEILVYDEYLAEYAGQLGIVLIPGIEANVDGRHVLILNPDREQAAATTFGDLRRLGKRDAVIIAPHPYYPIGPSLREKLSQYGHMFDAVEYNAMFTRMLNFNRRAVRWARAHGKPMVGNGDVHRLRQLGTTYSLVDAEPTPDAICAAIREGRVRVEAEPLSMAAASTIMSQLLSAGLRKSGTKNEELRTKNERRRTQFENGLI